MDCSKDRQERFSTKRFIASSYAEFGSSQLVWVLASLIDLIMQATKPFAKGLQLVVGLALPPAMPRAMFGKRNIRHSERVRGCPLITDFC